MRLHSFDLFAPHVSAPVGFALKEGAPDGTTPLLVEWSIDGLFHPLRDWQHAKCGRRCFAHVLQLHLCWHVCRIKSYLCRLGEHHVCPRLIQPCGRGQSCSCKVFLVPSCDAVAFEGTPARAGAQYTSWLCWPGRFLKPCFLCNHLKWWWQRLAQLCWRRELFAATRPCACTQLTSTRGGLHRILFTFVCAIGCLGLPRRCLALLRACTRNNR